MNKSPYTDLITKLILFAQEAVEAGRAVSIESQRAISVLNERIVKEGGEPIPRPNTLLRLDEALAQWDSIKAEVFRTLNEASQSN